MRAKSIQVYASLDEFMHFSGMKLTKFRKTIVPDTYYRYMGKPYI